MDERKALNLDHVVLMPALNSPTLVLPLWMAAMIETTRILGSASASMGARTHGELSERKRPGIGE